MKELAILVGLPAAGKTTVVEEYKANGYISISRDVEGGALSDIDKKLTEEISKGTEKIILDNTYITADSRKNVIGIGLANNFNVTCLHLNTSMEDAQYNAVSRMMKRHNKLFRVAADYKNANDPNMFPPAALYAARKALEVPNMGEGFNDIKTIKFKRQHNGYTNKAILLDYDGTLRLTKSGNIYPTHPDDVYIMDGRIDRLKEYIAKGYILLGVSNQSGVAKGVLTHEQAKACFDKTNELLGLDIDVSFCPHSVPPISCYCRKPGVGHGVEFIEKYKLDPALCIMVGDMTTDKTFSTRCGFKYVDQSIFFA
jgi:histidinol-phosphate phosphatase family protein